MSKEKIAFFAAGAVFSTFWILLMFLYLSGSLTSVSNEIPGLQAMVQFGLIGTPAIVPAVLTFGAVYSILYFQEVQD